MAVIKNQNAGADVETFNDACDLLATTLKGGARPEILAYLLESKSYAEALLRLRGFMRTNIFKTRTSQLSLDKVIKKFDSQIPGKDFHVMKDWDGKADRLNEDIIAVDVLNYFLGTLEKPATMPPDGKVLAILLDYYLMYVVAVLAIRAMDDGGADNNLDLVTELLQDLQGQQGSSQYFARNAETLILIATSHFEPDEPAYDRLLAAVRASRFDHQVNMAVVHASILASHLRHGFEDLYKRDVMSMRNDNAVDYPWLCFSVTALMRAYARLRDAGTTALARERVVEGILSGLTPDPRAFVGKTPAALAPYETDLVEFREIFQRFKQDLFDEFERHRPADLGYSPMAFNFNFPHNLLKAMVVNAMLEGKPSTLTLNDLLTGIPRDAEISASREALAHTLMSYARSAPDRINGRDVPVISYDRLRGRRRFIQTMNTLKEFMPA